MAKPELGLKRHCLNCGAKYYDLNRDPAVCPKCGTPAAQIAVAPSRAAPPVVARAVPAVAEDDPEVEGGPEMVSLDEVEASEADKDAAGEDEDIGAGASEDDTFLEEEEEGGDDVADLIDGDLEDDEEA